MYKALEVIYSYIFAKPGQTDLTERERTACRARWGTARRYAFLARAATQRVEKAWTSLRRLSRSAPEGVTM